MKVPIFVADSVMEEVGVTVQEGVDLDEAHSATREQTAAVDNLDVYRDFINTLDALDEFGKPD
jgi:hypothetical protein